MSNQIIDKALAYLAENTVVDIKLIKNIGTTTFSVSANSGVNVLTNGYVSLPSVPSGYTELTSFIRINGDTKVIPHGIGTGWVHNVYSSAVSGLTADAYTIIVKKMGGVKLAVVPFVLMHRWRHEYGSDKRCAVLYRDKVAKSLQTYHAGSQTNISEPNIRLDVYSTTNRHIVSGICQYGTDILRYPVEWLKHWGCLHGSERCNGTISDTAGIGRGCDKSHKSVIELLSIDTMCFDDIRITPERGCAA